MATNYSEQFGLEETFSNSTNLNNISSFEDAIDNVINQTVSVNEFGFVNIFDESTSDTIRFVVEGVLLTTVAVLGVLGNILSILVLSQKKIHASLTVLLIGLSLCDMFVCVLLMAIKGLPSLFKYLHFGTIYLGWICVPKQYIFPILQTVQLGSTYFTVAITFERWIAVCKPLQSKSISTYQKAKQLSFGIAIFSIASNSLMFYIHTKRKEVYHESNLTCQSIPPQDIPEFVGHLQLGIYVMVHYLIPLISVIVANVIIVRKIQAKNTARESITPNQRKEIRLTSMLIVVVLVYVVCNIFRVINAFTTRIFKVTYAELVSLTEFLVVFNSAVNYLIYCAYGQSFRDSFVRMFCGKGAIDQRRRASDFPSDFVVTEMSAIRSIRRFSKDVFNDAMNVFGKSKV